MTTATRPGAPFQGPSWAEAIADPSTLGLSVVQRTGKKFAEDQPRDDHGRWSDQPGTTAGQAGTPTDNVTWTRFDDAASRLQDARKYEGQHVLAIMRRGPSYDGDLRVGTTTMTVGADELDPLDVRQLAVYGNWGKSKDFSEELHPRDDHGRFTDTGSLGDTAIQQGGFSLSLAGDKPSSGWMVSKFDSERSFSIEQLAGGQDMSFVPGNPWHDNFTNEVDRFVKDKLDDLQQPGAYLGGWVDSGRLFLDVSYNFQDRAEAEQFATDNRQFAIYNAGTGEYVSFEQERRAAARERADQKTKEQQATEREKVLLKVKPGDDTEAIAERLHRALFG